METHSSVQGYLTANLALEFAEGMNIEHPVAGTKVRGLNLTELPLCHGIAGQITW